VTDSRPLFRRFRSTTTLLVLLFACAASVAWQPAREKPPINRYGLLLKYRKAGEDSFRATRGLAVECFQEESGHGLYISQTGALAVVGGSLLGADEVKEKAPLAQHGLELTVRRADGKKVKFGVECYRDENSGALLYVTETGALAVVAARYARPTRGKPRAAPLTHRIQVKVRKPGDSDETRTYGVDVFEDQNNDNLIYLGETGAVAVVPRRLVNRETTSGKAPVWQYGFRLTVRAAEKKRSQGSKKYTVEVFRDANNDCLIHVTDNGNLAVVPTKQARFPEGKPRPARSVRGLSLAVRKPQEKDGGDTASRFGVEIYRDENSGQLLYLSDRGALAVMPGGEETKK
jgi:hypothetical protein